MFARVSDKFHNRKQQSSPLKNSQSPPTNVVPPGPAVSPTNSSTIPQNFNQGVALSSGAAQAAPAIASPQPVASVSAAPQTGMEGVERYVCTVMSDLTSSHPAASPAPGLPPAAAPTSATDGAPGAQPGQQYEVNRTMSIEMADVSNLSLQTPSETRQGSVEEERMREKARSAQEQVGCCCDARG